MLRLGVVSVEVAALDLPMHLSVARCRSAHAHCPHCHALNGDLGNPQQQECRDDRGLQDEQQYVAVVVTATDR